MTRQLSLLGLILALFLVPCSVNAAKKQDPAKQQDAAKPQTATEPQCIDCHPDKREGKVVHPAIEMGCSSCHSGNHDGGKPAPKLTALVPDLCYTCHDKAAFNKKILHAPVAGGMCGSCHNPHSSGNPKMLVAAVPDLCFSCHDRKALAKKESHVKAAGGQCLTCHNPHGSDAAFVLNQLMEGHCESCHDEITAKHVMARISPNDRHPLKGKPDPLHKGRDLACSSCHNPHAAEKQRISTKGLKSPAPLCLRCHTKTVVRP
jgi:predicted CXXCH cytochrome family protein